MLLKTSKGSQVYPEWLHHVYSVKFREDDFVLLMLEVNIFHSCEGE